MASTILEDAVAGRATIVPWTVEQYHAAIEGGFLPENPALELIEGFIVHKDRAKAGENPMTIGDRHAFVLQKLVRIAGEFHGHGCHLRLQAPLTLAPLNEPEPDAAVVRGSEENYAARRPSAMDVLSVLEVADSSLARDLGPKLRLYAQAGIGQYVVVDLVNNQVLVHTGPDGENFQSVATLLRGQTLALLVPGGATVSVDVDRLLP